jgi:hypothetical protein
MDDQEAAKKALPLRVKALTESKRGIGNDIHGGANACTKVKTRERPNPSGLF